MKLFSHFFITLLILSHLSFSQAKDENTAINAIIKQDDALGKIRNQYCKTHTLSETILKYCYEIEKLDFSNCPPEFKNAFWSHRKAWLDLLVVTDRHEQLRGEMHVLFKEIENSSDNEIFKALVANVWKTWEELEEIAKSHRKVSK